MRFYPKKIDDRFQNPQNTGHTAGANAVGMNATPVCGSFLRFALLIDSKTKEIRGASFNSNGCGYLIAAADLLCGTIKGKKLTGLDGFYKLRETILDELGAIPENRQHCLDLALDALKDAFADFRIHQIEEFVGEKALICTCFGVSEEALEQIIDRQHPESVEEVGELSSAGTGCGSCQQLIQEILDHRCSRI